MAYFRLYESLQAAVPALAGFLKSSPPLIPFSVAAAVFLSAVVSQQLFLYTYNDFCDFERDRLNPRKEPSASRLKKPVTALAAFLFIASSFLISLLPIRSAALAWGVQALGIAYSHPRLSLRTRVPMAQFIHFAVGAGYFLIGRMAAGGSWERGGLAAAAYFGLLYMSGGLNNEILDLESDRVAGLDSLALVLGPSRALRLVVLAQVLAILALAEAWGDRRGPLMALAGTIAYTLSLRRWIFTAAPSAPQEGFRARYRMLFSVLSAALIASWVA